MTKLWFAAFRRSVLIAAGLLALGLVVCPRPPSADEVDARALLAALRTCNVRLLPGVRLPDDASITPLVEGRDTIAGRSCWVLRLKPRVKRTPWLQFWVDCRSHSILAFRGWDGKDRMVSSGKQF